MNLKGDSILLLENINTGSRLKQGDKTTLKFRLRDRDGEPMAHLRNTVATAYLLRNGVTYYKTDTEPITDDLVAKFKIDEVLPAGKYHVEIETIDGIFPSDDKTNFDISKSNKGLDQNVIEVYGIDAVVNKVVDKVAFDSAPSNISAEVIAARKGEPNLRQSIEKIEQNLENKKADKAAVNAQLANTLKKTDELNLNQFDEETRAVLQGLEEGEINAVLGEGNVTPFNTNFFKRNPENMIEPSTFTDGYLDPAGNIATSTASKTSPHISVKPNTAYRLQSREPVSGKTVYIAGYTDDKTFARRFGVMTTFNDETKNWIMTGATETKIRLSANVELIEDLYLHEGDDLREFPQDYFFDTQYLPPEPPLSYNEQTDFVELLKLHNESNLSLKARMTGDRSFWVYQPIANGKYIGHNFTKDTNDDFFVYASAVLCSINGSNVVAIDRYIMSGSNKEFAFFMKPDNTATAYWNPNHGTGTTFKVSQSIKFDGVEKIEVVTSETMQEVNVVTIRQEMNLTYPDDPIPVGKLIIVMTVNKNGVSYSGHVEWLKTFIVEKGYVNMLPINDSPVDTLRTSLGYEYDVTTLKANESIKDGDKTLSYAFLNKNLAGINNLVLAQTVINPTQSYRIGGKGRYEPNAVWVEHRTDKVHKLYPQIYNDHTVQAGDKVSWGAQIYVGILENADFMLVV